MRFGRLAGVFSSIFLVAACGPSAINVPPATDLYKQAVTDQVGQNYGLAIDQYRLFLDHYPIDSRAQDVELRLADSFFADEKWPESIVAYGNFQRMHPTHRDIERIEFRIAAAYYAQMDDLDRDLGAAQNAHERYRNLVYRHAGTPAAKEAEADLATVREHLAARELYVATFYIDRNKPEAGQARVAATLLRYPETVAAREAIARLREVALEQGDTELATLAAAALKDHPRSDENSERDAPLGPNTVALRNRLLQERNPSATP